MGNRSRHVASHSMSAWEDEFLGSSGGSKSQTIGAMKAAQLISMFESSKPLFNDENRNQTGRKDNSFKPVSGRPSANSAYRSFALASANAQPVIFKIISSISKYEGVNGLMEYLNKDETVELETSDGQTATSYDDVKELAKEWRADLSVMSESVFEDGNEKKPALLRHGVIGFPRNTNQEIAKNIARTVLKREFGELGLDYVMAAHFDEPDTNPHIHFAVKTLLPDGRKLQIDRAKIFSIRESISFEAGYYNIPLHNGMAYERGLKSTSNINRGDWGKGERPAKPENLSDEQKEKLKPVLDQLKETLSAATIRNKALDNIIQNRLNDLATSQEQSIEQEISEDNDNIHSIDD